MTTGLRASPDDLRTAVESVPDPEVPVVTIADLGIVRDLVVDEGSGRVTVTITPTYSGCPAMDVIAHHVEHVCRERGWEPTVSLRLNPAWSTDWMSDAGRDKLRAFGIAPPEVGGGAQVAAGRHTGSVVSVMLQRHVVTCPQCGSDDTEEVAHFGSTACKALRRCRACREPFDEFKAI